MKIDTSPASALAASRIPQALSSKLPPAVQRPTAPPALASIRPLDPLAATAGVDPHLSDLRPAPESDPAPLGAPSSIAMEDFLKAWGSNDPDYDLDGDGTVGMGDLLIFMSNQSVEGAPGTEVIDGAGGFSDLLSRLAQTGTPEGGSPEASSGGFSFEDLLQKLAGSGTPALEAPGSDFQSLLSRLAQSGTPAPEAAAGSFQDLLTRLARTGTPSAEAATAPTDPAASNPRAAIDALADRLLANFRAHGFDGAPPSNVHAITQSLSLPAGFEKMLLARISQAYPGGLGINLKG